MGIDQAGAGQGETVALTSLFSPLRRSNECAELAERADNIKTSPAVQIFQEYVTPGNVRRAFVYLLASFVILQIFAPEILNPMLEILPGPWRYQYKYFAAKTRLATWEVSCKNSHPHPHPNHPTGISSLYM